MLSTRDAKSYDRPPNTTELLGFAVFALIVWVLTGMKPDFVTTQLTITAKESWVAIGVLAVAWLAVRFLGVVPSATVVAGGLVLASLLMWYPPYYGRFLRAIGHGGGRFVTVLVAPEESPERLNGYLLVRTGTALMLFDGDSVIREIPLTQVVGIDQWIDDYWCLPGCDCEYKGKETRRLDPTFQ